MSSNRLACAWICACLAASNILTAETPPAPVLADAHETYARRFADSPSGVYEDGAMLFVIADFAAEGRTGNSLRARTLFESRDILREYASKHYPAPETPAPPPPLAAFPALLPYLKAVNPELGAYPLQYEGPARVLHSNASRERVRYVVALPRESLEASLPPLPLRHAVPDAAAAVDALQAAWRRAAQAEADGSGRLAAALYEALHLPEDLLRLANRSLRSRLNADSLVWGPVSPHALYAAFARMAAIGEQPLTDSLARAAEGWPVAANLLAAWASADPPPPGGDWGTLNARLLALAGDDMRQAVLADLSTAPADGYGAWLAGLATRPWPTLLAGKAPKTAETKSREAKAAEREADINEQDINCAGPAATAAWRTLGHANFPEEAPDAQTPEYREARHLFDAGEDLERLAGLLLQSIESSPRHAPSWALLGDALLAANAPEDAIWPLTQALRLAPEDADTRASLAVAYRDAGRERLAMGMAASVLALDGASAWSLAKAGEALRRESGDEVENGR